jgi:hypothetical protein
MINQDRLRLVHTAARKAHAQNWGANATVSIATKKSQTITLLWQAELALQADSGFAAEYPVGGANERFDLVDVIDRTVYELKVSGNNPHHEFYKDIFKVFIHNRNAPHDAFQHFVFFTTASAVRKLQFGLAQRVAQLDSVLGFTIDVFDIANVDGNSAYGAALKKLPNQFKGKQSREDVLYAFFQASQRSEMPKM